MAVVLDIQEKIGTDGAVTLRSAEFTREYIVKLDTASNVGQDIALHAALFQGEKIPEIGDLWPNEISGRALPTVRSKKARVLDNASRLLWLVTVEYSNVIESEKDADPSVRPWQLPAVYAWDSIEYQRALEVDFSTTPKAVVNTVGDPFDPVPQTIINNDKITITRNSRTYSDATASALRNKINAGAFTIRRVSYPAQTLRLIRWTGQTAYWNDDLGERQAYFEETIEIERATAAVGFKARILNQGYRARPTAGADPERVEGAVEPVLLAGNGTQLVVGATPHFLEFQQYETGNFSALGDL